MGGTPGRSRVQQPIGERTLSEPPSVQRRTRPWPVMQPMGHPNPACARHRGPRHALACGHRGLAPSQRTLQTPTRGARSELPAYVSTLRHPRATLPPAPRPAHRKAATRRRLKAPDPQEWRSVRAPGARAGTRARGNTPSQGAGDPPLHHRPVPRGALARRCTCSELVASSHSRHQASQAWVGGENGQGTTLTQNSSRKAYHRHTDRHGHDCLRPGEDPPHARPWPLP